MDTLLWLVKKKKEKKFKPIYAQSDVHVAVIYAKLFVLMRMKIDWPNKQK